MSDHAARVLIFVIGWILLGGFSLVGVVLLATVRVRALRVTRGRAVVAGVVEFEALATQAITLRRSDGTFVRVEPDARARFIDDRSPPRGVLRPRDHLYAAGDLIDDNGDTILRAASLSTKPFDAVDADKRRWRVMIALQLGLFVAFQLLVRRMAEVNPHVVEDGGDLLMICLFGFAAPWPLVHAYIRRP